MLKDTSYIVVGGGIAGLTVAYMLAEKGYSVKIVSPSRRTFSASIGAAGIITTLMPPKLAKLALESASIIRRIAPESIKYMKAYWIPEDCRDIKAYNMSRGVFSVGTLPRQIRGVDGVLTGTLAVVDTGTLISTLMSRLASLNALFIDDEALNVSKNKVHIAEGELEGTAIVAAGPWSRELLPSIKPVTTVYRCQALSLRNPPDWMKNTVIIDDDIDFYIVCWERDCVIGDGSNDMIDSVDDGFNPDVDDLLDVAYRASERLPWILNAPIAGYWAAPCIAALDAAPLIGESRDGVLVLTGFNGAGVTLAPASAKILVDSITGLSTIPRFLSASREVTPVEPWPPEPFRLC